MLDQAKQRHQRNIRITDNCSLMVEVAKFVIIGQQSYRNCTYNPQRLRSKQHLSNAVL